MKLKELLLKRSKGEDLTEEELAFLKEYDESMAEVQAQLELERQAKALAEEKFTSANTELQDKLKAFADMSKTVEQAKAEKEAIENLLETQKTTAEVKVQRARLEAEETAKREREAKMREKQETEDKIKAEMESYKTRLAEAEKQTAITNFKFQMMSEKVSRPYLANEIDSLLSELETKGIEISKTIYEYLVKTRNHEEEMLNFKKKQESGTSIFQDLKTKVEVKEDDKKLSDEERILARVKKLGLKTRK